MTATVSVMRPADTPTAEAKAIAFKRPAVGDIANVIGTTETRCRQMQQQEVQQAKTEQKS